MKKIRALKMATISQQDVKTATKVFYINYQSRGLVTIRRNKRKMLNFGQISANNFHNLNLNFHNLTFRACANFDG